MSPQSPNPSTEELHNTLLELYEALANLMLVTERVYDNRHEFDQASDALINTTTKMKSWTQDNALKL